MSDYYIGMKRDTFVAHNKHNIHHSALVCSGEGAYVSEYLWNDGRTIHILWSLRLNQVRIMYIEEENGILAINDGV